MLELYICYYNNYGVWLSLNHAAYRHISQCIDECNYSIFITYAIQHEISEQHSSLLLKMKGNERDLYPEALLLKEIDGEATFALHS